MTNEEAKRNLRYALEWKDKADPEALKIAIKALEQPSPAEVLAAVREEIKAESYRCFDNIDDDEYAYKAVDLEDVLGIIDKHMEELK